MSLLKTNWHPQRGQLRQFGLLLAVILPGLAWWWAADGVWMAALTAIGLLAAIVALAWPRGLLPLFIGCTLVTMPIGWMLGELAMLLIYWSVFVPMGLGFRLAHRDRLQLRTNHAAVSYWTPKRQATSASSYYRQS